MKITDTVISIPPYISTGWENVSSLHVEGGDLVFTLKDGKSVFVPNLSREVIEQIFSAHTSFLETHVTSKKEPARTSGTDHFQNLPFRFNASSLEGVVSALQHNPAYSGLPPIPDEITSKITGLSKVISEEEVLAMPPAEINCNCMYCQIYRVIKNAVLGNKEDLPDHPALSQDEEKVPEEELRFEQWEITQIDDKLYKVINKLDRNEEYSVFLGDTIGCTCGKPNCEHIIAVLRS